MKCLRILPIPPMGSMPFLSDLGGFFKYFEYQSVVCYMCCAAVYTFFMLPFVKENVLIFNVEKVYKCFSFYLMGFFSVLFRKSSPQDHNKIFPYRFSFHLQSRPTEINFYSKVWGKNPISFFPCGYLIASAICWKILAFPTYLDI